MSSVDKKVVYAIITGDIHLRDTQPIARTDDYFEAQAKKISFLCDMQKKHRCPILDAGDLFNKWKSNPFLETWSIKNLPAGMITVPGNHEIPSHNINLLDKSSLAVLEAARKVSILREGVFSEVGINIQVYGFPYGTKLQNEKKEKGKVKVALIHAMVWDEKKKPSFDIDGHSAMDLLKALSGFDLIITGHNHKSFVTSHQGRYLVNPGSLMRMSADQLEYRPNVFLWTSEGISGIAVPIKEGVVDREYIERKTEKDERLESFVSRMKDNFEIGLSFEKNMESFLKVNKTRKSIQDMVWRALNGN